MERVAPTRSGGTPRRRMAGQGWGGSEGPTYHNRKAVSIAQVCGLVACLSPFPFPCVSDYASSGERTPIPGVCITCV